MISLKHFPQHRFHTGSVGHPNRTKARSSSGFARSFSCSTKRVSAAGLIIGNEVLNGSVAEKNISTLAKILYQRGVDLERAEVVRDDFDDIGESLERCLRRVNYVFTSGGIGPTHDDITYEAVARWAKKRLVLDESIVQKMVAYNAIHKPTWALNEARKRMALFPEGSEIIDIKDMWAPIVCVEKRVFILPGIPSLFEQMLEGAKSRLPAGSSLSRSYVYTRLLEGDFAQVLAEVQRANADVTIGSYPNLEEHYVRLSVEGRSGERVAAVVAQLRPLVDSFEFDVRVSEKR